MNALRCLSGLLFFAAMSASVQADEPPALLATGAWIRTPAPGSPVAAGYVTLVNPGKREVRFASAQSDAFGAIEIHEMRDVDGLMRMRRVTDIVVSPGDTVSLQPGGLHLMLFRPNATLADGETVTISLGLDAGKTLPIDFDVRSEAP